MAISQTVRPIPLAALRRFVVTSVGLVSLGMYTVVIARFGFGRDNLKGLTVRFDPRFEASLHSWLGSALLLGCAALLACIAFCRMESKGAFARHWAVLAGGFLFLSIDESAELHELLIGVSKAVFGQDSMPHLWAVFGALAVAVIAAAYAPFIRHLPAWFRNRTLLAGAIYLGGAVGIELLGGWYGALHGAKGPVYLTLAATEETFELAGAGLYLLSLYAFVLAARQEPAASPTYGLGSGM